MKEARVTAGPPAEILCYQTAERQMDNFFFTKLGGGLKHILFSSLFGELIQFDAHIFQMGWFNHKLENWLA